MNEAKEQEFEPVGGFCEKLLWEKQLGIGHTWVARINSNELKKVSYAPFWAKHPIVMLAIFVTVCFFSWPFMTGLTVMLIKKISTNSHSNSQIQKSIPLAAQISTQQSSNTSKTIVAAKSSIDLSVLLSSAVDGEFRAVLDHEKVKLGDILDYSVAAATSSTISNLVPMPKLGDPWLGDSVVYKCSQTACLLGLLVSTGDQTQKAMLLALRKNDPSTLFNVLPLKVDYKYTALLENARTLNESQAQALLNDIFK